MRSLNRLKTTFEITFKKLNLTFFPFRLILKNLFPITFSIPLFFILHSIYLS
ncbi:hypothetical protein LEP1GSC175_1828 [Leptospira santarosai str. HAI821]|nr:hypothetical protein LEP1GSC039_0560 [Leptospira santarosai str. 2000027870]EMO34124.1 hypothetical protein LEP1GSC175_1828 [Leptospira santarosai str. HAI821]